jgi:ABC-type transport system substrate-binding protein
MVDTWKRAGFEINAYNLPIGTRSAGEPRYTFPGIQGQGSVNEAAYYSANVGTAQNRWTGANNGGFSNADYDRVYRGFISTLDQTKRTRQWVQLERIFTEQLPAFITHFSLNSWAVCSPLARPEG